MRISTKGRYALRLLIDIAENSEKGVVSLKDISERQGISKKYLEQIVPLLSFSGLLKASRGFKGGYKLGASPSECTVGQILRLTEVSLSPTPCLEDEENSCERKEKCDVFYVWEGLNNVINEYLNSITLQDILDKKKSKKKDIPVWL